MREKKIAVVGVGNVLMADDGIGPAAIKALQEAGAAEGADLLDAGTAFHEVVFDLDGYDKLIVIDAVQGGGEPGAIYRFELDDIRDAKELPFRHLSAHELSVLPTLGLHDIGGRKLRTVVFIGVEPEKIEWRMGLSETMKSLMPRLVKALIAEIGGRASSNKEERDECNKQKAP
ncbi:MAG: hydrogenase maturation protease [Planctomycetota bacterium]